MDTHYGHFGSCVYIYIYIYIKYIYSIIYYCLRIQIRNLRLHSPILSVQTVFENWKKWEIPAFPVCKIAKKQSERARFC